MAARPPAALATTASGGDGTLGVGAPAALLGVGTRGFFFAGLYLWGWSERKFAPGSYPTVGNMLHNFWYWGLGIAQWTCWECVVMRLWATGKVPFVTNAEVLASSELLAWNLMWVLLTPIWR